MWLQQWILVADMKLSDEELKRISESVNSAEKTTSGEIATAIIKESSDYAFYELAFSLIIGGLYFIGIMLFSGSVESWLKSLFWDYNPIYLSIFTGFSIFIVIGISYVLSNIPVIDRFIIPKKVMQKKVHNRAVRHFIESGTCYTQDRTGILIFISQMERKVVLLADKGINERIPQSRWDKIVSDLVDGIKRENIVDSITNSVKACGEILRVEFPIKEGDINELSDDIQVLKE